MGADRDCGRRGEPKRDRERTRSVEDFTKVYERNNWGCGSGVGSPPLNNIQCMELVRTFITRNRISSVVDYACGRFRRYVLRLSRRSALIVQ